MGSQNLPIFDHWDGLIESDATVEKKSNSSVLKFPRPIDIFEPKLFWKWAGNLFSAGPWKNNGNIKNLLTTIRNDQNKIDIIFRIPEKVLTGTKYDIDIILNEPLGDVLIAGGIISHQDDSYLKQEINIEPLASGGIFKTTRASSKPARQIWSGIIAHPKGTISFTKSVEIVEKI